MAKAIFSSETRSGASYEVGIDNDRYTMHIAKLDFDGTFTSINQTRKSIIASGSGQNVEVQLRSADIKPLQEAMRQAREQQPRDPRKEREMLANSIAGLYAEITRRNEQAWERADERGGVTPDAELSARLEEAEKKLTEFDAAHPEVLEEIAAEKQRQLERGLWR
jgi:hypothetical protein